MIRNLGLVFYILLTTVCLLRIVLLDVLVGIIYVNWVYEINFFVNFTRGDS